MRLPVLRVAAVVCAVVGLSVVAAVPAPAATDVDAWADTFCTETSDWLTSAEAGVAQLQQLGSDSTTTPLEAKAFLVEFFRQGVTATKAYEKAIKAGGAPDVPKGAKIRKALVKGIGASGDRLAALVDDARALSTTSSTKARTQASALTSKFRTFIDPWSKALNKVKKLDTTSEIDTALATVPSCVAFGQ